MSNGSVVLMHCGAVALSEAFFMNRSMTKVLYRNMMQKGTHTIV